MATELTKIETFLSSQVNQGLVIAAVSAIAGFVTQYLDHSLALTAAVAAVTGVVSGLGWPQNPAIKAALIALSSDLATDVTTKTVGNVAKELTDVGAVVTAFETNTKTVVTTPPTALK